MNTFTSADRLHRLVKQALDSGAADSLEAAQALFQGYRLTLRIGADEARRADHQAALLTAVTIGRRVFLGGVRVEGDLGAPLQLDRTFGSTVADAVAALGGNVARPGEADAPVIIIGGPSLPRARGFHLRTAWWGWRGGVVPAHVDAPPNAVDAVPLACMLSATLAVSEAFFHVRGGMSVAGRRALGLSLWNPGASDWQSSDHDGPPLERLPSKLWLIGLGHLGQAYLWGLGLLPYSCDSLSLVLQDVDIITPSTESTSILTDGDMVGKKKTRAMADWAERRGFATTLQERFFDARFERHEDEPGVALCGIDNALGRRALDKVGFDFVVEAGLGRGHRDFQTMRLHTLPGSRTADELWKPPTTTEEDLTHQPGYRKLLMEGALDRCGVTLLAGKAVGAPFVGATAACLALSEVLRLLHGGPLSQLIDLDLLGLGHQFVTPQTHDFSAFNPGYTAITG